MALTRAHTSIKADDFAIYKLNVERYRLAPPNCNPNPTPNP